MAMVPTLQNVQEAIAHSVQTAGLSQKMNETVLSIITLALAYLFIYFIFAREFSEGRGKKQFRIRLLYGFSILTTLAVAKVWVTGFAHIIAVLGLFSAFIVFTSKEFIMNLLGGLIISWRLLFKEKDHIQLQQYSGIVLSLGILYFKLLETSPYAINRSSGKMIKVPNSIVITNTLINFSQQSNFIEFAQRWTTPIGVDPTLMKTLLINNANMILAPYYENQDSDHSISELKTRSASVHELLNFKPHVTMDLKWDKPSGITFTLSYYCYPRDRDHLDWLLKEKILQAIKEQNTIHLLEST